MLTAGSDARMQYIVASGGFHDGSFVRFRCLVTKLLPFALWSLIFLSYFCVIRRERIVGERKVISQDLRERVSEQPSTYFWGRRWVQLALS